MAKTIWKYPLAIADGSQQHEMPSYAQIVHVGLDPADETRLALWAIVDPQKSRVLRTFSVHGTGHTVAGKYLGSVRHQGTFMWHVFEGGPYLE